MVVVALGVGTWEGGTWVREAVWLSAGVTEVSVAVIVALPGVVELVTVAVYAPPPWSVTALIVSPGSLEVIVMFCVWRWCPPVTVAVAVLVDVPLAMIDVGVSVSVTFGGSAIASAASPHQLRHVDRTTAPTR